MFKCGDKVLYGSHGVCELLDVETKRIDGKNVEYYILQPINQPDARFYIPTGNQAVLSKLRPLLTKEEIGVLLTNQRSQPDAWIAEENQRKQRYRELISSSDRATLISMIHALHKQRQIQQSAGRKLHLCDENFLRDAEKLLGAEFSLVLNIRQDAVGAYIQRELNKD